MLEPHSKTGTTHTHIQHTHAVPIVTIKYHSHAISAPSIFDTNSDVFAVCLCVYGRYRNGNVCDCVLLP